LQKEGSIKKLEGGRYEITEKGKQEFEWPWGMQKKQPRTIDEVIAEISGYVSYMEDIAKSDSSKIAQHSQKIKDLQERLSKLGEV
jgi:predicted transcriptional regulator